MAVDQEEAMEEMGDEDSQNSYVSRNDFDPDDTMISQQTAATELTQPLRSRANQVSNTSPKNGMHLTNVCLACRDFATEITIGTFQGQDQPNSHSALATSDIHRLRSRLTTD